MARRFSAWCASAGHHRSDFLTVADSFEEAALDFVETWIGEDEECRIVVVDEDSGAQRCFALHHAEPRPALCAEGR